MKKIISLFKRDYEGRPPLVYDEAVEGAEWVLAGEGTASRKWDGTCAMVSCGKLWKRYDAKKGKTPPEGFVPAQNADPVTGHWPGWLEVGEGPEDKWFREALAEYPIETLEDGTYELIGPKINGNPERTNLHELMRHGVDLLDAPRDFEGIKCFLGTVDIEGIVWHRDNGDMVKIKGKDFGVKRGTW